MGALTDFVAGLRPGITLVLTFMCEFHLVPAQKNGKLGIKQAKIAKRGQFW